MNILIVSAAVTVCILFIWEFFKKEYRDHKKAQEARNAYLGRVFHMADCWQNMKRYEEYETVTKKTKELIKLCEDTADDEAWYKKNVGWIIEDRGRKS